jgi:uncharacterized phage protein (TIGR01671 family)
MREIKFRVFNGSEMEYNVMAGKFGAFFVNPSNNGISENDSACLSEFNTKYHENTPVMQYTGLKDKNGKEIYEGDYVTMNGFTVIKGVLIKSEGEIVYCDNIASFGVEVLDEECEGSSTTWSIEHFHGGFEVIGNVYENPELLK